MAALDGLARAAGDGDVVCGVPARWVAEPADTTAAAVLITAARGLSVAVRGGATKLDWGTPPRELDLLIDTRRLAGVVEHAAGDLITVVRAGTRMDELDRALHGQCLALDAPPGATAGGTVATGASGPRRLLYGTARELLIGITVVRPDGRVTRAGGKVVKNVAGYDLGKLYTGSYGTLGLITECVFRLHPEPAAAGYVRAAGPPGAAATVRAAQLVPSAIEVNAGPDAAPEIAVLVEGTPAGVAARAARAAELLGGAVTDEPPPWWGVPPWPAGGVGMKLTAALSAVPALVAAAVDTGATVRGSAGTGVLYAGFAPAAGGSGLVAAVRSVRSLRAAATRAGGHGVVLTAPAEVRGAVDMWGPVAGLELMRRVKDRFDPDHRFAPGRFVGGL